MFIKSKCVQNVGFSVLQYMNLSNFFFFFDESDVLSCWKNAQMGLCQINVFNIKTAMAFRTYCVYNGLSDSVTGIHFASYSSCGEREKKKPWTSCFTQTPPGERKSHVTSECQKPIMPCGSFSAIQVMITMPCQDDGCLICKNAKRQTQVRTYTAVTWTPVWSDGQIRTDAD